MPDALTVLEVRIPNSPVAHFGSAEEDAPTDSDIDAVERTLGVVLSPSYKWWLRRFGGGDVGGEEILSMYPLDDGAAGGGILSQ